MIENYVLDWLSLFFRWFHFIAGVAWIGASFYFIWLDNNLREPPQWKQDKGIKGDLWAIHGGGIYEVAKYRLAPESMPPHLHWFKWEAYTTWLTGFTLLWIVYYLGADRYLLKEGSPLTTPTEATLAGLSLLAGGVALYEIAIRTPLRKNGWAFVGFLLILLTTASLLAEAWFAPRGAFMHVGALIGTIMVGNVLLGIMPAQRELVKAIAEGREPDPAPALLAKLRSTHNNYLSLPVLFIMISNHYPQIYGHPHSALWLLAIGATAAFARHFFNLRHRGIVRPSILVVAALLLIGIAIAMMPQYPEKQGEAALTDATALTLFQARCATCHSAQPTDPLFSAAPAGLLLETLPQIDAAGAMRVHSAVQSGYMPLANRSGMQDVERQQMLEWLAGRAREPLSE
jgi:uncharacterized membrane protein